MSALPSWLFTTLGTGHPIFTSRMSNGLSSIRAAVSAIISGSEPNSCNETGDSCGCISKRASVFLLLKCTALALIISMHKSPAPCSLHRSLNGKSVTPAIGASITLFFNSTFPILILFINLSYFVFFSYIILRPSRVRALLYSCIISVSSEIIRPSPPVATTLRLS